MSTLSDLLAEHSDLSGSAVARLQAVVSEWQLLADLSFSDLLLWVPTGTGVMICAAQARPTTGVTAFVDDRVSGTIEPSEFPLLRHAWEEERVMSEPPPLDAPGSWIRREVIPVRHLDGIIALIERDTSSMVGREASLLETAYVDAADDLFQMVADGTFPPSEHPGEMHTGPRAGDGLLRLDADGKVVYVSPNALSAYHRLAYNGEVLGQDLAVLTRPLIDDPFDAAELAARIDGAVDGRAGLRMEVEARAATVLFRALPLRPHGRASGALVLVRDVTEVRRRDRALLSKDATIREIHHRVKNNLQTVAALLRMQGRRSADPSVRQALSESMRRVASIALVHETLSTSPDDRVDLDQIVDRLVPMISDVAAAETSARVRRVGTFGILGAELATPLVMVLAEIVQNALQHAFGPETGEGQVTIAVDRSAKELDIVVSDDGQGLPEGFSMEKASGLGLQIVRTLVDSELLGSIEMCHRNGERGTAVRIRVPLRGRS
jgi:two-component sensor histidine kinase/PAS domain-containing protein